MHASPRFCLCALVVLTGSCSRPDSAPKLVDGCYYAKGKPVFKIAGSEGRVLIPGDVKTFKVERADNASVTFVPGLLFDGSEESPSFAHAFPGAPSNSMKAGTSVPTIQMHWAAYGDQDVYLGKPC